MIGVIFLLCSAVVINVWNGERLYRIFMAYPKPTKMMKLITATLLVFDFLLCMALVFVMVLVRNATAVD